MIKRLRKSKKSKQGAILVVVVLILALAMIFIASALMLTQATRNRLYGNAMSSQARITVTAASEVFWEAVEMQEITDSQIEALLTASPKGTNADKSHTDDQKIKMVVPDMPGMTEDENNCTLLDLYYPNYPDKDTVYCDFKTTIGDQVENIRLILGVSEGHTSNGGRFKNQIDIGTGTTSTQLRYTHGVGMLNPDIEKPTDNTILVRGSATDTTSSSVFYSDLVYASNGQGKFGSNDNYYHGNMIFLKGAQFASIVIPHIEGDIYFIGDDSKEGGFLQKSANQWNNIESTNIIFSGRYAINDNTTYSGIGANEDQRYVKNTLSGKNCYFLNSDGDLITVTDNLDHVGTFQINNASDDSVPGDISDNVERFRAYRYDIDDPFPTDALIDVFSEINPDGQTKKITAGTELTRDEYEIKYDEDAGRDIATFYAKGSVLDHDIDAVKNPLTKTYPSWKLTNSGEVPTGYKLSMSELYGKCSGGYWDCPAGYYMFTPGKTTENSDGDPNVICIDGSKAGEYRFYFTAGSYTINKLVFAVYNVSADPAPVVFILEPGAKLSFSENANSKTVDALCSVGFISVKRPDCTSASAIASVVRDTHRSTLASAGGDEKVWDTNHKTSGGEQITYSQYYDGVNKPCIFVYGTGSNVFKVGSAGTYEAYIGLYGGSNFEKHNYMSDKVYIYGRIEADKFAGGNNPTGGFCMPYCPSPNKTGEGADLTEAKTKYHVANVAYYY